jgi:hypothetical protein
MHIDAFHILAIDIAAQMWTNVNDQAFLSLLLRLKGCSGTIDAGTNYQ